MREINLVHAAYLAAHSTRLIHPVVDRLLLGVRIGIELRARHCVPEYDAWIDR